MAQQVELKWVLNTVSGFKRQVGPNIYNNPFRMKVGNWELIEAPVEMVSHEPEKVNYPDLNFELSTEPVDKFPEDTKLPDDLFPPKAEVMGKTSGSAVVPLDENSTTELKTDIPPYEVPVIPDPVDPILETPAKPAKNKK